LMAPCSPVVEASVFPSELKAIIGNGIDNY
jgi:hypothetical protein